MKHVNYPQLNLEHMKGPKATLVTSLGEITVVLFPEQAPKTVQNFLTLAEQGYYQDILFHRVIPDFMIQTGDPTGTGRGGESSYGAPFEDEFSSELIHLSGALSMANAGPNTNGSQFFIVQNHHLPSQMVAQLASAGYEDVLQEAYVNQGGTPWLDHRHTIFGHVISGMDVVDQIANVQRNAQDCPLEPVYLKQVIIEDQTV